MFEKYNPDSVARKLKNLRESRNWSQSELAQKIDNLIGINSQNFCLTLSGDTGKQTISQLERGARNLTMDLAFAYSEIFGVSLDYLFGKEENFKAGYKEIKIDTGLNDLSIQRLDDFQEKDNNGLEIILLNIFISRGFIFDVLEFLNDSFIRTAVLDRAFIKTSEQNDGDKKSFGKEVDVQKYEFAIFCADLFKSIAQIMFTEYSDTINELMEYKKDDLKDLADELYKRAKILSDYVEGQ